MNGTKKLSGTKKGGNMTKEELEDKISELEEIKEELECRVADLEMKGGINNLENFIYRLKLDGYYSNKLGDFIEEYIKYYND